MKNIKILGTGCRKCEKLADQAKRAAEELKVPYTLEKITDIDDIISFGVMMTPALVIDEDVKSSGKVLSSSEIKKLLI